MAPYFSRVYYFEDFGSEWHFSVLSGAVAIHRGEESLELSSSDTIYLRGPNLGEDESAEVRQALCVLVDFLHALSGKSKAKVTILNKFSQLAMFGGAAPRTEVFHNLIPPAQSIFSAEFVCKSISNEKSTPMILPMASVSCESFESPLRIPTLFQQKVSGREIKVNAIAVDGELKLFAISLDRDSGNFDSCLLEPNGSTYRSLKVWADLIAKETGADYFDFDVIIQSDGTVRILEWNNSIGTAVLEAKRFGLPIVSLAHFLPRVPIVIGQSGDRVIQALAKTAGSDEIVFLPLERHSSKSSRSISWELVDFSGLTFLRSGTRLVRPSSVYLRMVDNEDGAQPYPSGYRSPEASIS